MPKFLVHQGIRRYTIECVRCACCFLFIFICFVIERDCYRIHVKEVCKRGCHHLSQIGILITGLPSVLLRIFQLILFGVTSLPKAWLGVPVKLHFACCSWALFKGIAPKKSVTGNLRDEYRCHLSYNHVTLMVSDDGQPIAFVSIMDFH